MCGFAGALGAGACDEAALRAMASMLRHRGPDDAGVWRDTDGSVGLAHVRLSILDLSPAGHQPMLSGTGRYVIAFNGEIYNHLSLRAGLERAGASPGWRGHSDTETLLAAFDTWGIRTAVEKCVGMFAFAVWDRQKRTLTLARDRIGEKPLYYGRQGDTFLFGSELKAFRVFPRFKAEIDEDALTAFMRYSYVPAPWSIYRGIFKLRPGTLLTVSAGERAEPEPAPAPYWKVPEAARRGLEALFAGSDTEALQVLESRLSDAVALQRISDVPLGAFLSGGIDSSTIVALMQARSARPIHTFAIGFDDEHYNEAVHAHAVARHLGTSHTELYVKPEDARAVIPRLPTLYDEPFADPSQIPTFLVSQLARRDVTVCLSGDGGDELFGGYNRYSWTRKLVKTPVPIRRLLAAALSALSPAQWDRMCSALNPLLPAHLTLRAPGDKAHKLAGVLEARSDAAAYERLISAWAKPEQVVLGGWDGTRVAQAWSNLAELGGPENRMMALDAMMYLPDDILCKVDRAAMGVSLETRVPFLDHRVVEFAWRLPLNMKIRNGQGKWILRELLYKYVPKHLIERPKMGFGVPIDSWLRGPLRQWAEDLLDEPRLRREGYLDPAPIREKWTEHLSGKRNWQYQLWNILMFQSWLAEQNR